MVGTELHVSDAARHRLKGSQKGRLWMENPVGGHVTGLTLDLRAPPTVRHLRAFS